MSPRGSVVLLLSTVLILAPCGCTGGERRAEAGRKLVSPGMSLAEVEDALGPPRDRLKAPGPQAEEEFIVWVYRFETEPDTALQIVTGVLVVVAVVGLVAVAAKGGGGGLNIGGGGGDGDSGLYEFRVTFDSSLRVCDVGGIRKLK